MVTLNMTMGELVKFKVTEFRSFITTVIVRDSCSIDKIYKGIYIYRPTNGDLDFDIE